MNHSVPAIRTRVNAATISSQPSSPLCCPVQSLCVCVCASSRLSDVSCVAVVCSVGQREVPAGDYFSLGPWATALHQSLHWERPATGSQEFHTHTQMPSLRERKQKQTDQRIQNQRNTEQCLGNLAKCFHLGHIFSKIRKDVFPQTTKTIFIDYLSGLKQFFFFK